MFELLDFNENPNVGVYCRANDAVIFLQKGLSKKIKTKIKDALQVKLIELNIADANIIGSLLVINSKGAIVTDFAEKETHELIKKQRLSVFAIKDVINAVGNDILANDNGVLVHPDIKDASLKKISDALHVPAYRGTIAELKTVGMAAVVTNKGCLTHPKITDEEKKHLEDVFDVEVMIGTINHGFPLIGSGLIANSNGAVIGNLTTGIELNRIEEALGFLD